MVKVTTTEKTVEVECRGHLLDVLTDTELAIKYIAQTVKDRTEKRGCSELYGVWLADTVETLLDV